MVRANGLFHSHKKQKSHLSELFQLLWRDVRLCPSYHLVFDEGRLLHNRLCEESEVERQIFHRVDGKSINVKVMVSFGVSVSGVDAASYSLSGM